MVAEQANITEHKNKLDSQKKTKKKLLNDCNN